MSDFLPFLTILTDTVAQVFGVLATVELWEGTSLLSVFMAFELVEIIIWVFFLIAGHAIRDHFGYSGDGEQSGGDY